MSANTQILIVTEADKVIERKQKIILWNEVKAVRKSLETLGYPTPAEISKMVTLVDDAKQEAEEAAQAFLDNHDKIDKMKMALAKTVSTEYLNEAIEESFESAIDNAMMYAMARDALGSSLGDESFLTKLGE